MGTASIQFLPVCSACKKVLFWETIDVVKYVNAFEHDHKDSHIPSLWYAGQDVTEPEKCPYCGAFFDQVEMPTKLPFTAKI